MDVKDVKDAKLTVYLSSDSMNNLPPNIIQTILTLMPMRDAFKTSILSRNWRNHCSNIPKLHFDDELFQGSTYNNLSIKCKLSHVIYPILLLHQGPIIEFSLCISQLISCSEIDLIILHLSRNSALKNFTLWVGSVNEHKLLPSFFKLQQLTYLNLENCSFQPPTSFYGFSKLTSLYFHNVSISCKVLLSFLSNCPLLTSFTLIQDEKHLVGCWNSGFLELFECLPLIEHLHMSSYPFKCFAIGDMQQKLPTALDHLKVLNISGLCFAREVELRSALFLITSAPNIEKIKIEMYYNPREAVSESAMNLIELQDFSNVSLDHMRELDITNFSNTKPVLDFLKLILAKSAMLKKVGVMIDKQVDVQNEVIMLRELIQYPRASTKAEIVFKRP